jgi:hypothetical protein
MVIKREKIALLGPFKQFFFISSSSTFFAASVERIHIMPRSAKERKKLML